MPVERQTVDAPDGADESTRAEADAAASAPSKTRALASPRRRLILAGAALVGVLAAIYLGDVIATAGEVPRGVTAAGVPIGGLSAPDAEQRLRDEVSARGMRAIPVTLGSEGDEIDPTSVGLTVDWRSSVQQAGSQPLNPLTRIASLFSDREIGVVSTADDAALTAALDDLGSAVAKDPIEGTVRFVNREPVPVDPQAGRQLDVEASAELIKRTWAEGSTVTLPLVELAPRTTPADVVTAIHDYAGPAMTGAVTITGDRNAKAVIDEDLIAAALTFTVKDGRLVPELNQSLVTDAVRPQLAPSEVPGRDAAIDFAASPPVKVPSQDGRRVDYDATLDGLLPALTSDRKREIAAVYVDEPAKFTTADLDKLGDVEVIGEFRTGGFAGDSGQNIKRAAAQINGAVVKPGETFSLNGATNPRNAAAGYVEAGIIERGRPARGVGGGVSQVATTLFNAAYFAGMVDIAHQEHSYYISRYPAGREATAFADVIDVKFRNDDPTPVQIQTEWTPSAVTVRLLGIKRHEVSSEQSARSAPTSPETITVPAGESCSGSSGAPGFTITDTRTVREIETGETNSESHTVTYDPIPQVICGG